MAQKEWVLEKTVVQLITESVSNINNSCSEKLVKFFEEKFETTFIIRYKRNSYGRKWTSEEVRHAFEVWNRMLDLNEHVRGQLRNVQNNNRFGDHATRRDVSEQLRRCASENEAKTILLPFQSDRATELERLRALNLEEPAKRILRGECVRMADCAGPNLDVNEVSRDLVKMLAHVIHNDKRVAEYLHETSQTTRYYDDIEINIHSVKLDSGGCPIDDSDKYKQYNGYKRNIKDVETYEFLAMERAASKGYLHLTFEVNAGQVRQFHPFREQLCEVDSSMKSLCEQALRHSITHLFIPRLKEKIRNYLWKVAEADSIEVFYENVKHFIAQEGITLTYVIALDPGFKTVKAAFLNPKGKVLGTCRFLFRKETCEFDAFGKKQLLEWMQRCEGKKLEFAIGDGLNTHDTQKAAIKVISSWKSNDIHYRIIPEDGASKYSITADAQKSFKGMDVTEISAVSIGRRLIDPLSEFLKIPVENLGKGMYQHSIQSNLLKEQLEIVVRELVSFGGVNVNTASVLVLQRVCGLTEDTAKAIVRYRKDHGKFHSRNDLKKVPGITEEVYNQCAGFLLIPKRFEDWNPFDATTLHPDQYDQAAKLLFKLGLEKDDVLDVSKLTAALSHVDFDLSAEDYKVIDLLTEQCELLPPPPKLKVVKEPPPVAAGTIVEGTVRNMTRFGVFVDFGAEFGGLCHVEHYKIRYDQPLKEVEMPKTGTNHWFKIKSVDWARKKPYVYLVPFIGPLPKITGNLTFIKSSTEEQEWVPVPQKPLPLKPKTNETKRDQSLLSVGDLIKGTVRKVDNLFVVIDFGGEVAGCCPVSKYKIKPDQPLKDAKTPKNGESNLQFKIESVIDFPRRYVGLIPFYGPFPKM